MEKHKLDNQNRNNRRHPIRNRNNNMDNTPYTTSGATMKTINDNEFTVLYLKYYDKLTKKELFPFVISLLEDKLEGNYKEINMYLKKIIKIKHLKEEE